MTREEAQAILGDVRAYLASRAMLENELLAGHSYIEICNAIKALEQEPCEDCISRQAVLDTLDTADKFLDEDRTVERYKALLKESYKVLSPKPQEPCEDVISRQAVLELAKKGVLILNGNFESVCKAINEILSAKPQEPKTGHWIPIEECTDWYDATYECSCCGRHVITPYELSKNLYEQYPYCHCGAKMESEG